MILYFNPGHETAVVNGSPYYMAPANVVAMQQELAFLPAWYGNSDDVVLCDNIQHVDYFNLLRKHFPALPQAVRKEDLIHYRDEKVSLWGISPQVIHFFNELKTEYKINLSIPTWKDEYRYLNGRLAAKDCLVGLCDTIPDISTDLIPQFCTSLDDIEKLADSSPGQLLAKAPYSSSGRGLLWLPVSGLTRTERQILHGMLKKQGAVSIEKVVDKKVDFAMEFIADGNRNIYFAGYSLFDTNIKGSYSHNRIMDQKNIETLLTHLIPPKLLFIIQQQLCSILSEKYASLYEGCIGVDMMIYENDGKYKLHPCVEINMRYNMGFLSLKLQENYIAASSEGKFCLDFEAKEGVVYNKHLEMEKLHPPIIKDGRLAEGYLSLCPVLKNSRYWAYILIGKIK